MYLKYTFKNIASFIKNNFMIFVLLVMSTLTSSVVLLFSYGIYQSYHITLSYADSSTADHNIVMWYTEDESKCVTKDDLLPCLDAIDRIQDALGEDIEMYSVEYMIDGIKYGSDFRYEDSSFAVSEVHAEFFEKYDMLKDGSYWGDYEEANAVCVAIVNDENEVDDSHMEEYKAALHGDSIEIGGNEYKIIGVGSVGGLAEFPFSTVSGDTMLLSTIVYFDSYVATDVYDEIADIFSTYMGDRVEIDEAKTFDRDTIYTYRTVVLISIFIALTAALNFMILYRYIMSSRKKETAIFRMLGLTPGRLSLMNLCEYIILTVPVFIIGMVIFAYVLLPRLSGYFMYMEASYSIYIYLFMFLIFVVMSVAVVGIMIFSANRRRILDLMSV